MILVRNMADKKSTLKRHPHGFYHFCPVPSSDYLKDYYTNEYWLNSRASHKINYQSIELDWLYNRASVAVMPLLQKKGNKTFLDIGCGEGFVMEIMSRLGYKVTGIDFSVTPIKKFHPHLSNHVLQGSYEEVMEELEKGRKKFDVIFCGNIIEHLAEPEEFLKMVSSLLTSFGKICLVAPNDFSALQDYLVKKLNVEKWWVKFPDHLNYFNKTAMINFLSANGMECWKILGDYPMEFNLFNPHTSYLGNKLHGASMHESRMATENYLYQLNPEYLFEIYEFWGKVGAGRNLYYYCSLIGQTETD